MDMSPNFAWIKDILWQHAQRLHVALWHIHKSQSYDMAAPLKAMYVLYSYMGQGFSGCVFRPFVVKLKLQHHRLCDGCFSRRSFSFRFRDSGCRNLTASGKLLVKAKMVDSISSPMTHCFTLLFYEYSNKIGNTTSRSSDSSRRRSNSSKSNNSSSVLEALPGSNSMDCIFHGLQVP